MLAVLIFVVGGLVMNRPPDAVLFGAVVLAAAAGIITPGEALSGFGNPGLVTVAALFVVSAAMRETGALDTIGRTVLGKVRSERGALARMAILVPCASAFLNNTPIVAMFIPVLTQWGRKNGVSPSRLLLPLSYMAILGGTCTLIGTSTNLVINGMMTQEASTHRALADAASDSAVAAHHSAIADSLHSMGLFEMSYVGVPYAIVGILYLLIAGPKLLPQRKDFLERLEESSREYLVNFRVSTGCSLIGQQVEEAGLRHLSGLFLIEIGRGKTLISPVGPSQTVREGDVLTFTGVIDNIVDLERIPGLVPVADESYISEAAERRYTMLCEAVISNSSPLIGKNIRDANFRAMYNAAVVAVSRGGERLKGRVGDIVLKNGDTLLLQAGAHFTQAHRNNSDFFLVSGINEARAVREDRAPIALGLLALLIALMSFGLFSDPVVPALLVAGALVISRCISTSLARESLDYQVLITIGAALGMGSALTNSGLVEHVAHGVAQPLLGLGVFAPYAMLALIYLITAIITELVTNNAAAALLFPFAIAMAAMLGVDARPFVMGVVFAASAAFVTPIGYQTNLMVFGPGGYRGSDFVRVGLPLSFMLLIIATFLIPRVWAF